jgi:anti-sigma-K factor RskA
MPEDLRTAHITEQASDYALGLCEEPERTAIERHLAGCRPCTNDVAEYRGVLDALRDLPLATPRAELWEQIEDEVARAPRRQPLRSRVPWRIVLAAATVAVAFALGVAATRLADDSTASTSSVPANVLATKTDDLVFTLAAVTTSDPAIGRIFMSTDRTQGVIAVSGLPRLSDSEEYAVWIICNDHTRLPAGTFSVGADGAAIAPLHLPSLPYDFQSSGHYVALSISRVETADPTTPMGGALLVGPLY